MGQAIQLKAVNNCGFLVSLTTDRVFPTTAKVRITCFYKMSGTPGSGTFKLARGKNGTSTGTLTLPVSATYTSARLYYELSGFTSGDILSIGAYNSGVTDQTCNIAAIIVDIIDPLVGVSSDNGDADITVYIGVSERTQIFDTALTAARTVTLDGNGAANGDTWEIIRTANATGAYNLNVGTGPLKALSAGEGCEVKWNGSAYILTKYWTL